MKQAEGARADAAAEGAWLAVSDALLRGVGHAMNNRAAAVSAVVQVLAASGEEGPLEAALRAETDRLQRAVELLRLLPRQWGSDPEPVRVEELIPNAIALLALHSDLPETRFDWDTDGPLPPVLVEPSLLIHLVCLLGTAAGQEAARTGARAVAIRGSASTEVVTLQVSVGEPNDAYADDATTGGEVDPRSAGALLAMAGGDLTVEREDGLRVKFTLPTLAAGRRAR
ncbi:MAG: hypothetical protein KY464_00600 [Gemmatimonadetes bacterium]|nr:hypothetical protein [Gemmatimonadota bacterium]